MIKLPVFWIEEEDVKLQELGVEVEPTLIDVYFVTIEHFYPVKNGIVVVSGGLDYHSPVSMNDFIEALCNEK